ncbi:MAG: hypothetical protein NC221_08170 [Duncaniella sp.]|nr:hypothetical protein [Duncaniella sp.]
MYPIIFQQSRRGAMVVAIPRVPLRSTRGMASPPSLSPGVAMSWYPYFYRAAEHP